MLHQPAAHILASVAIFLSVCMPKEPSFKKAQQVAVCVVFAWSISSLVWT